ncbi:hypothetical protein DINM_002090 [Dirofilaria immitis]|nr:hypothetical protein [Dirofilaria immitis]
MDITEYGFLAITAVIGGIISIALPSILNCARRQSSKNRKVLKEKWPLNDSFQYHQHFRCGEATTMSKRHKGLTLDYNNSDQKKYFENKVNNDSSEERMTMARTGTTSTQMTSTFASMQSCGSLNQDLNLSHVMLKSNRISEMASGDEELPDRLKPNIDDKSIKERNWISEHYDPNCHNGSIQILAKHKNCDKKRSRKEMIDEYKLMESVAIMIQKYEEQSRVGSEQDMNNF